MIRHIVALDAKRGIAKDGTQPWDLPKEARYFHDMTMLHGANILMGRKTFDVVGLLPGRQNCIVSSRAAEISGATVVTNLFDFLKPYAQNSSQDIWIIGGAAIYEQTLSLCDELYITEIDADLGCDKFYVEYDKDFTLKRSSEAQAEAGLTYYFRVYEPRT